MPYAASKGGGRCRIALKYRRKRHEAPLHRTLADSMIANSRSDNAGIFFVSCCSTRHEHLIFFVHTRVGVPTTECCTGG
jgi:hypothetical protein